MRIFLFILFSTLFAVTESCRANCESELRNFKVGFPKGSMNSWSYELSDGYFVMSIHVKTRNRNNSRLKALATLLDDAAYAGGSIHFSVTPAVCQNLEQYRLPVGFGGSYSHVRLQDLLGITRAN